MGGGRTKATIRSITMQLPVDIIYRGKLYPSDNFLRLLNREMTETNMLDANNIQSRWTRVFRKEK